MENSFGTLEVMSQTFRLYTVFFSSNFITYFPAANAWAPGQRLDWRTEMAYWGISLEDTLGVHGGRFPISASSERGVRRGGPTSGSGSSGSSRSSSSSSSSTSSGVSWPTLTQTQRPWGRMCCTWCTQCCKDPSHRSLKDTGSKSTLITQSLRPINHENSIKSSTIFVLRN